ncbi:MAG: amino acid racemase [Saccharofermentans sp.]|nr:amino acid racemase [Saccharofermentans sp.]
MAIRKIGLVGGTGPESTLMYYKELNSRVDKITNGEAMPDIVIESVDFRKAWNYVVSERYDLLADYLSEKVKKLQNSGAEVISLTAVTMHIVANAVISETGADLVSIPRTVCDEAVDRGYKRIGLLGTVFTMEKDYMKEDFRNAGISVTVPDKTDRDLIAKRILEELELGVIKDSTLNEFQAIIKKMKENDGIEAVVLGCTELPLLLNSGNCPVPCLDSVEIHIEELIKQAMAVR